MLPELAGIGAIAGGSGELGVGGEAIGAGDLTDELGRGQRPAAALGDELWRDWATRSAISVSSALMV